MNALEAAAPGVAAAHRQILVFRMDGREFGVPLDLVAEIQPWRPLNRMPHMPRSVDGLLELRGQVVPVVNLRRRLGLPALEDPEGSIILVVEQGTGRTGILVDQVEGVAREEDGSHHPASRLLVGPEGEWVTGFLVSGERIVTLIDPARAANPQAAHVTRASATAVDLELRMDEDLRELIALAPPREDGKGRIVPQIEGAIAHTEEEMGKVLGAVEAMLAGSDQQFGALGRIKQEAALGRLKGEEARISELEETAQRIQDEVFRTMQFCQFQDIARQKLERVLHHIQGMQGVVGRNFRDLGKAP